jgi:hypothetical protein
LITLAVVAQAGPDGGVRAAAQFTVAVTSANPLETTTLASRTKFHFVVTNQAGSLDYITIQRSQVRGADGREVLGIPSPEFGLSLPAGASGPMWWRWDLDGHPPGTYSTEVPFKSLLTGDVVRVPISVIVLAPPEREPATITGTVVTVDGTPVIHATVEITDLATSSPSGPSRPFAVDGRGQFSVSLRPSTYAVRVDADDLSGQTQFVTLVDRERSELQYTLRGRLYTVVSATTEVVNVSDSIWSIGGSRDLTQIATAPMVHREGGSGTFYGVGATAEGWRRGYAVDFRPVSREKNTGAGQFQALDGAMSVSADGAYAAGMDWNGDLHVIDQATGIPLWIASRDRDTNPVYPPGSEFATGFYTGGATAFSPDGTKVAGGGSNGWLVVFDTRTGDPLWSRGFGAEIRALRFTPDGTGLAVGGGDWYFRMLNAADGTTLWNAENDFWPFFFIATDTEGKWVGTGGKNSIFTVWDAATGAVQWRHEFTDGAFVSGGGISDDRSRVMVSDWQYGVHVFDGLGSRVWFRDIELASTGMTPDGEFVFVSGFPPGRADPSFRLLDRTGTVVWQYNVDLASSCLMEISPFQRNRFRAVMVAQSADRRTITGVATCVGGSVFRSTITLAPVP